MHDPTQTQCIVVADDESGTRTLLARLLSQRGYEVLEACDGEEAMNYVASRPVDLLLCDLQMPKMRVYKKDPCDATSLSHHSYRCGYDTDVAGLVVGNDEESKICPNAASAVFAALAGKIGASLTTATLAEGGGKLTIRSAASRSS